MLIEMFKCSKCGKYTCQEDLRAFMDSDVLCPECFDLGTKEKEKKDGETGLTRNEA